MQPASMKASQYIILLIVIISLSKFTAFVLWINKQNINYLIFTSIKKYAYQNVSSNIVSKFCFTLRFDKKLVFVVFKV